jgi:formamidopyrimidine-DNA glycosylase
MAKTSAGNKIKCKKCGGTATIILDDGRYIVYCPTCQTEELLKNYNIK